MFWLNNKLHFTAKNQHSKNEKGSALVYILIAIALLAALTVTFMQPASQQTSSQNTFKIISALESQISLIESAIQECVLSYPAGDINITETTYDNYPIDPDSTYYATATPGQAGNSQVRNMRCPGNNPGGADVDDHALIFSGSSGKFLGAPPDLFEEWQIYNDTDGVYFWTYTTKSDAFIATALEKMDDKYSECQMDVVETSGSDEDLDSEGNTVCANGSTCLRMRMITASSADYNGDSDNDEVGCP